MPYGTNVYAGNVQYPAPAVYQNSSYSMPQMSMQQAYQMPANTQIPGTLQWVDGEVGARAWQFPQGWPVNTPVALWDTNDYIIYLKSMNNMGIPNPIQKIHYTMDEVQQPALMAGQSGASMPVNDYVTKEDMRNMESRIMAAMESNRGHSEANIPQQQQGKGGGNR